MIKVYHLVDNSRFRDSKQILFFLYLPIGLLLICFRIVALLILCINCLLLRYSSASQYLNSKLVRIAFGIAIETENLASTDRPVQVFVGNSVSHFDVFVINQLTGSQALIGQNAEIKNVSNWMKNMKRSLGYCLDCKEKSAADHMETHLLSSTQKSLFIQPEMMITNGKSILQFDNENLFDSVFRDECRSLGTTQPVVLQVYRRWFDIAIVTVQSTLLTNIFWYLISPQTRYTVRFLEPCSLNNAGDLKELRQQMLKALKIEDCQLSAADVQQYLHSSDTCRHSSASFFSTEYLKREVQGKATVRQHSTSSGDTCKNTTFSSQPKERMQSLDQRKKEMIEQARRRYLTQANSQQQDEQLNTTNTI